MGSTDDKRGAASAAVNGLHIVVFSKDRACQLDSLLRSLRDHVGLRWESFTVLYRAGAAEFVDSYALLERRKLLPGVSWHAERDFRSDLLTRLETFAPWDRVMFLVDDDIFHRPFDADGILGAFTPKHLFISLRCSRSYGGTVPAFTRSDSLLEWRWHYGGRGRHVWNYPFSLDGNVFHAGHVVRALRGIDFKAPNSLEGNLHTYRHKWWVKRVKLALAPLEAVVVNNPLNRVQAEGETWHQDVSASELNRAYLDGKMIDNGRLYSAMLSGVHCALDVKLVDAA